MHHVKTSYQVTIDVYPIAAVKLFLAKPLLKLLVFHLGFIICARTLKKH